MRHDGRVVAGAGADVHHVVALSDSGAVDPLGMPRRLAVVEMPLGDDLHDAVDIEVDRVVVGRGDPPVEPARHHPGPGTQKILAAHGSERRLQARIADLHLGQDLFGVGAANDDELFLPIHLSSLSELAP